MFLPCFMNAMITVHTSNLMFLPCFMNEKGVYITKKYKNLILYNNIQKYTITMVYYYYNLIFKILFKILFSHVYNILATFQTN